MPTLLEQQDHLRRHPDRTSGFLRLGLSGVLAVCLLLGGIGPDFLHAKPKTDKFHGTVVSAGPKAITVKSRDNVYKVRTFNYSPSLEQKMQRSKPEAGKKVTVHYVRGSDLATKVD